MSAMHGIAGLEGDDPAPAQTREFGPEFSGSKPQSADVIMRRHLKALDAAADIPRVGLVHYKVRAGMRLAGAVEDRLGFSFAIRLPDVLDVQRGQHDAFGIPQRDLAAAGFE